MPKLIVTSRYMRKGSNKNLKNYVKYIATREGVVRTFNECENYVGYIANRPNSHGLFSQTNASINLNKIAKEISEHKGNIYTHVVSLRRDDAQKMGYDNLKAWRDLVIRQIPNIAKNQKIDLKNLRWYAAFHDKKTNPHVHIIIYSTNEREGFLTNHGIEKIRSGFANDIYTDELKHLYQQQTNIRNLLKVESAKLMKQLSIEIAANSCDDTVIIELMKKLHGQLQTAKGKKVYGYLKKDVKKTVDEIFLKLSHNESIQKMYKLWCDMEQSKHDFYSSAKVDFPSMIYNERFKSVKNMIIRSAVDIQFGDSVVDPQISPEDNVENNFSDSGESVLDKGVVESNEDKPEISEPEIGMDNDETVVTESNNYIFANAAFGLLVSLSRIISGDYDKQHRRLSSKIDRKLRRTIDRKKQELGLKLEFNQLP